MRAVRLTPTVVGVSVGIGDGLIDLAQRRSAKVPFAHLGYGAAVIALGWFGTTGSRNAPSAPGRWDPNTAYGLMTAGVTMLATRIPDAIAAKSLHAYGDTVLGPYHGPTANLGTPTPASLPPPDLTPPHTPASSDSNGQFRQRSGRVA